MTVLGPCCVAEPYRRGIRKGRGRERKGGGRSTRGGEAEVAGPTALSDLVGPRQALAGFDRLSCSGRHSGRLNRATEGTPHGRPSQSARSALDVHSGGQAPGHGAPFLAKQHVLNSGPSLRPPCPLAQEFASRDRWRAPLRLAPTRPEHDPAGAALAHDARPSNALHGSGP